MNKADFKRWCATPRPIVSPPFYRGRPLVMGILNVTPDSFSDGGLYVKPDNALKQAEKMIAEGADILDIGAESTRPGSTPIDVNQELVRLMPVLEKIVSRYDVAVSVDTSKPEVMEAAVLAGAVFINDVFALQKPGALEMAAKLEVPVCLMHMHGVPETMQVGLDSKDDVILRVQRFFEARIQACLLAGIPETQIVLDPGFGFGKTTQQNLKLIQQISVFPLDRFPLLLGVSRKSTIGTILQQSVNNRLSGGLALSVFAALQGATIIRTHDVGETRQALDVIDVVLQDKEIG